MGALSKEAYERKREWAARRMAKSAENESLTEEQHEVLAWLCRFRHQWHTSMETLFNTESAEYSSLWTEYEQLNEKLSEAGLERIEGLPDAADFATSDDFYNVGYDVEYEDLSDWIENGEDYSNFCKMHEKVNNDIEHYLQQIDKKYGTEYCPSGSTRLY